MKTGVVFFRYSNYGGGNYQGGYGRGGMGGGAMGGGMGGFQLGAKRKGDFYDDFGGYDRSPKKPFGGGGNTVTYCVT